MKKPRKSTIAARNRLAFRLALLSGWPRDTIIRELGISLRTFYYWRQQAEDQNARIGS